MESRRIELKDEDDLQAFFMSAYLPAPFFTSIHESMRNITQNLFDPHTHLYGYFNKKTLVALAAFDVEANALRIKNLLFLRDNDFSSQELQVQLLKSARQSLVTQLLWPETCFLPGWAEFFATAEKVGTDFRFTTEIHAGLVLGGGGAKGAYQIGVFQAYEEFGHTYEVIVGTSVGALNAGLIIQDDIQKAISLWQNIDTKQVLDVDPGQDVEALSHAEFFRQAFTQLGFSTSALQQLITDFMYPEKIQGAPQQFYIVTTQVPQMKEVVVDMKKTAPEKFADWLVASSSFFPVMALKSIDGQTYMDGGYRNNLARDVAFAHGANQLITIDVKGVGRFKNTPFSPEQAEIFFRSPWQLGEILLFQKKRSQANLILGYLDGLKAFSTMVGYWYTYTDDFLRYQFQLGQNFVKAYPQWKKGLTLPLLVELASFYQKPVTKLNVAQTILELLGLHFSISPLQLYTGDEFIEKIQEASQKSEIKEDFLTRTDLAAKIGQRFFNDLLEEDKLPPIGKNAMQLLQDFLTYLLSSRQAEKKENN